MVDTTLDTALQQTAAENRGILAALKRQNADLRTSKLHSASSTTTHTQAEISAAQQRGIALRSRHDRLVQAVAAQVCSVQEPVLRGRLDNRAPSLLSQSSRCRATR